MDNVIVVVVIESKKYVWCCCQAVEELFWAELLLLPRLLDARGRAQSVCFYGMGFFCVCVVFRFVCLSEMQLLTGHHCQMWFLLKAHINITLQTCPALQLPSADVGIAALEHRAAFGPWFCAPENCRKQLGRLKNKARSKQRPYSDVCQRSSEASWWKVWMYLV